MISLRGPTKLSDGVSRREWLRIGGLSTFGLSLADVLAARSMAASPDRMFGRARNVILLFLAGGPPQHETFDPKPGAPAEIRGLFQPIQTSVPGIEFCELLPRTAAIANRLAVVRSMFTNNNIHGGSGYWVLTGRRLLTGDGENAAPSDWPAMASVIKMLRPSENLPPLSAITLPEVFMGNGGNLEAGQFAGFLGPKWNPEFLFCNPADPAFDVPNAFASATDTSRLAQRRSLLGQIDGGLASRGPDDSLSGFSELQREAFSLLTSGQARQAFAIGQESPAIRERYGRTQWGQCVLLARRLIEAGVRFVTVHWPREPGDRMKGNPLWDTHLDNFNRMKDVLAPQFDIAFSALIEDLTHRGLLDETLVIAVGEFGRTPKVNANAGRDHWGPVFSCVLAGGGIAGGQVFGASDRIGGYPALDPVSAGTLAATVFHLVGIDHRSSFLDRQGREHPISDEEPLYRLLGTDRAASLSDSRKSPAT